MVKPYNGFKTYIFITFISLVSNLIVGQEKISVGEKLSIQSDKLNQQREYWVGLPKSYNDTIYAQKSYPVLYFFDGNTHFENLVAQRNWLTRNLYSSMPEVILVGILQKDRANELTPTTMETPKEWKRANFSTSGGNDTFMLFIEDELKPLINKNYRTNGFEILSGHSFGGLATMHTFVSFPSRYNAYIAIDPSIWWDNNKVLVDMENAWLKEEHKNKLLFLAKANDPGSGDDHHNGILNLHKKLKALGKETGFSWGYQYYEQEGHGSVVIPAQYDALRYIFNGYQMPVKKAMKDPSLLEPHFTGISKKLGYVVKPDEALIDQLAKVCVRQELVDQSKQLLLLNSKNHPESEHAKDRLKAFVEK